MTFQEMQEFLNRIQAEKPQTKIMNAVLTCYGEVKTLEGLVIELQQKVNEIIQNWNRQMQPETYVINAPENEQDAATVNQEEDAIVNDIAAAEEIIDE